MISSTKEITDSGEGGICERATQVHSNLSRKSNGATSLLRDKLLGGNIKILGNKRNYIFNGEFFFLILPKHITKVNLDCLNIHFARIQRRVDRKSVV